MHITIIGLESTYNLGDPLLLHCTQKEIETHIPDVTTEILNITGFFPQKPYQVPDSGTVSRKKRKRAFAHTLSRFSPYDRTFRSAQKDLSWEFQHGLNEILQKIRHDRTDLVLFAGGQMFMRSFILPMREILNQCQRERVPVIFHSCGFGPVESPRLWKILQEMLLSPVIRSVTVRDFPSKTQLAEMPEHLRKKLLRSADMGLYASEVYSVPHSNVSDSVHPLGLGVISADSVFLPSEIRFFRRLIHFLEEKHISWKLFTNGHPDDEFAARAILKRFDGFSPQNLIIPRTPEQLVSSIASFDGIISCRLHSHIVAASCGVPSAAMVWDRKVPEFFRMTGTRGRCFSFRDDPEIVFRGIQDAKKNGWNSRKIEELKAESLDILIRQIQDI